MVRMTTTRWTPDTCKCTVEYEWDRDLPADQRVHIFKNLVQGCPEHSGLRGTQNYTVLLDENQRKNKLLGKILDEVPTVRQDRFDEEQQKSIRELKPSIIYDFHFEGSDDKRILHFRFLQKSTRNNITITATELEKINSYADSELGGRNKIVMD